jgi:GNAT superfamily N-acetyltransferase
MLACALGEGRVTAARRAKKRTRTGRAAVSVRDASLSDAKAVAVLVTALGYPTNAADMKSRLEGMLGDPTYHTFVAEVGGEIVGFAGVCIGRFYEKNGLYARIVALVVSEASSGKGVGAALARDAEAWASEQGASEVFLNTGLQRTGLHEFFGRLGYRVTGMRFSRELA